MPIAEEREATALVNAWLYVALADGDLDETEQAVLDERIAQLYPVLPDGAFARMFGKAIVSIAMSTKDELFELITPDTRDEGERLLGNLRLLGERKGGLDPNEQARLSEVTRVCIP